MSSSAYDKVKKRTFNPSKRRTSYEEVTRSKVPACMMFGVLETAPRTPGENAGYVIFLCKIPGMQITKCGGLELGPFRGALVFSFYVCLTVTEMKYSAIVSGIS